MWASITSGTLPFLQQMIDKNKDIQFHLMKNPNAIILYYEHAKKKSLFVSGRTYEIVYQFNELDKKGFVTMEHIPVTKDGAKVFAERWMQLAARMEKRIGVLAMRLLKLHRKQEFVILTQWQSEKEVQIWQQSPNFEKYDLKQTTRYSAYFAERPFTNQYVMLHDEE